MTLPDWVKPGVTGAIVGAALVSIIGFSWGGWVTGDSATKMANEMAHEDVIAALVPVCLEKSRSDIDRMAKLATITEASNYKRGNAMMESGWATPPGMDKPSRDLADACVTAMELPSS